MADPPRIEELRRRVRQDPASIAFAALAEEYRRLGRLQEAVETCRKGLQHHTTYHSARVTLARALAALGQAEAAASEFEQVVRAAPENLVARRGLADLLLQLGDPDGALVHLRVAAQLASQDPGIREALTALEHAGRPRRDAAASPLVSVVAPPADLSRDKDFTPPESTDAQRDEPWTLELQSAAAECEEPWAIEPQTAELEPVEIQSVNARPVEAQSVEPRSLEAEVRLETAVASGEEDLRTRQVRALEVFLSGLTAARN